MNVLERLSAFLRRLRGGGPPAPPAGQAAEVGASGGLLLLHLPEGARIDGLGPGGLLEVGEQRVEIGGAEGCAVVVRWGAFGERRHCALAREGDVWSAEQLPGAAPTQVADALLAVGRRSLANGDLVIPGNGAGYGPFFLFLRFDPATRRSVVLPCVERALQAAFPDTAAARLAEVSRWFQDELLVAPEVLGPTPRCSFCGAFATSLTALHPASFDFVADLPDHVPSVTLQECPSCLREPFAARVSRAAGAEAALADTLRALVAAEEHAGAAGEVERRFQRARPRAGAGACVFCDRVSEPTVSGAEGRAVCEACLSASRARWS